MTAADLQALRDFMAEKVMGWEYRQDAPKGFFCRSVGNNKGWWRKDRNNPNNWACAQCSWDFRPDLDSNQLDMLVDRMIELGFGIEIYINPLKNQSCNGIRTQANQFVRIYNTHGEIVGYFGNHKDYMDEPRNVAVLLAIKAAMEETK